MEAFPIIVIILVWALSAFQKVSKKAKEMNESARRSAASPQTDPSRSIRPAEMDLPGAPSSLPVNQPLSEGESEYSEFPEVRGYTRPAPRISPTPVPTAEAAWEGVMNAQPVDARPTPPRGKANDPAPVTISGLGIAFTADSMVKGVIFSEILTRRGNRRPNRRP